MKKLIALILIAGVLLGCTTFTGCSSKGANVMEFKGYKITEAMYQYWVSTYKANILKACGVKDSDDFWNTEISDGKTADTYYTEVIDQRIKDYVVSMYLFRYYGLKLSDDVKQSITDDINEKIEYYGSRADLNSHLATLGINVDILKDIYTIEEKHNAVYNYLYGGSGVMAASKDDVKKYYSDNYSRMYYIVLWTTKPVLDDAGEYVYDTDGTWKTEDMTAEELAAVRAKAKDLYEQAQSGTDADFVKLMGQSDFDILKNYPDGLFVSVNEYETYGANIVSSLQKMEPGDVTTFEEEQSIWILRKLELTEFDSLSETDVKQLASIESYTAQQLYTAFFADATKDVTVNSDVKAKYSIRTVAANSSVSSI